MQLHQLAAGLRARDFSSRELTEAVFSTIEKNEPTIGAYITLTRDLAMKQADRVDKLFSEGRVLPALAGIPGALKDNIATSGIRTTNASKMLADFVPPYDAFVWRILKQQEMVLTGKLNMDEFAMGRTTEASAFHVTRNPYDTTRIPGGSSGGSAAAVASGEACFALGTDTGGSSRQPATYCGIVGMRPTFGLVSRRGVTSFASSFDQAGPMTRSVRDNALLLDVLALVDHKDPQSVARRTGSYVDAIEQPFGQPVIGWPQAYVESGELHDDVKNRLIKARDFYESIGARIVPIDLKTLDASIAAYYLLTSCEGFSSMNRYDGIHFGYRSDRGETLEDIYTHSRTEALGPRVRRRILLGCFALSRENFDDFYMKAAQVRTVVIREFEEVFRTCDAILTPSTATPAWKLGAQPEDMGVSAESNDRFTLAPALTGMPALAVPTGLTDAGLPVGMQLIGPRFSEGTLYRLATAYEDAHGLLPSPAEVKA